MRDKFTMRPYKIGDSRQFAPKKLFGDADFCHDKLDSFAADKDATVFTCFGGDKPIAVIGGTFIFPGVMDLWSLTSDEVLKYPLSFARTMRRMMERAQRLYNIHRFQTAIRCELGYLSKWAEFLGMKWEGRMRKFGPDKSDHFLFARVY